MAEELQGLLERIQKDGIEKAEAEAGKTVDSAREKAEAIVAEATTRAAEIVAGAEKESQSFAERARRSIEQAARDTVLSIGEQLNQVLKSIVAQRVAGAMQGETLSGLLSMVVKAYCESSGGNADIEILLNAEDRKRLADTLLSEFARELEQGLEIKGDDSVTAGFRVSVTGEQVEHDFSAEAATESICRLLRPRLAEIVKAAMQGKASDSAGGAAE